MLLHTHGKKTSITQKTSLRKNCEWGEKTVKIGFPTVSSHSLKLQRSTVSLDLYSVCMWLKGIGMVRYMMRIKCPNTHLLHFIWRISSPYSNWIAESDYSPPATRLNTQHGWPRLPGLPDLDPQRMRTHRACAQLQPMRANFLSNSLRSTDRKYTS